MSAHPKLVPPPGQVTIPPASSASTIPTVVIVDDEPLVLRSLARQLSRKQYVVETFDKALDAVERVGQGGVAAVISDISMPEVSGMELLRLIREVDPDLPVTLITGTPALDSATRAVDYGAFKYLAKPIDPLELERTVEQATRLYRLARMKREALTRLGVPLEPTDLAGLEAMYQGALSTIWIAFQPIVSSLDGSVFGYEALLRSRDTNLRMPLDMLQAAERLSSLDLLSRTIRALAAQGIGEADPEALLFVNLHPHDLLDPELGAVDEPLTQIADRVVLEITERAALPSAELVRGKVGQLRAAGFRVAVDDLGAGYSGLSTFAHLVPEFVKLDMTLVRDIDREQTKQKLVSSMTRLCKDMGMRVIAEGVETLAERETLIDLGCDLLQGFMFALPDVAFPVVKWPKRS